MYHYIYTGTYIDIYMWWRLVRCFLIYYYSCLVIIIVMILFFKETKPWSFATPGLKDLVHTASAWGHPWANSTRLSIEDKRKKKRRGRTIYWSLFQTNTASCKWPSQLYNMWAGLQGNMGIWMYVTETRLQIRRTWDHLLSWKHQNNN